MNGDRRIGVVVMVDSLEDPGGGERLAVENAARLDPTRFEVTFCLTRWRPEAAATEPTASSLARLEAAGVRVVRLRRTRLAVWAWRPLLRVLRGRVDIIHSHLFGSNVWAVVLGKVAGVPIVVAHEHIWSYEGKPLRRFLDRHLIARFSTAFVAVSEDGRRLMVDREGIRPDDIVVIPNGIEPRDHGDGARVRAELELQAAPVVVGSVGNLRAQKAFEVLIEAAGLLRSRVGPGLRVLIAGEGPERAHLGELIAARRLEDVVSLLGARADVPDLLDALDVAVCCSDFEGSPLSVMEYMQAGLPVVGTRIGGLDGLVVDGESGILVPPRDPPALADAVARLRDDPELRRSMGIRGEELCREKWRLETWIERVEGLYLRLVGGLGHQ